MKVVRQRMPRAEMERRLRCLFEMRLKGLGMSKRERTKMIAQLLKCHAEKLRVLGAVRRIRKVYEATKKRKPVRGKKSKVAISRCLGVSRKKCPDCDARLRIWPGLLSKTRLLCGRCGWSSREPVKGWCL